ncbi:MAG TPA: hypothetical protein VER12_17145 [Polyangiaceae bacterium]|nr:hypothetical protein [Polyangiaceae bacterium]
MAYPARAKAESKAPIELKWNALEGCPSADTVLARVHKIAGTTRPTPNTLRAEATITQPSDGLFRLRLEIRYGDLAAVRDIEGKSCKDLAGAAAVALALLLSSEEPLTQSDLSGANSTRSTPGATTTGAATTGAATTGSTTTGAEQGSDNQSQTTSPDAAAKQPVASQPSPSPSPPPSAEASSPRRWRLLLVAPVGALGVGPLPELSKGLGGALGISFERWQFLVEGKLWASQRETIISAAQHELEYDRFTVGARGCRSFLGPVFELGPCLVTSVHHLSVQGSGNNLKSSTDTVTWAAVGLGAQARLLVAPWLGFVAGIDGELQLSRPEVSITEPDQGTGGFPVPVPKVVERFGPFAATITVGSQWIF